MEEKKLPHDHGQSMERELEQMPSVDDFQTVADIFKQLGRQPHPDFLAAVPL